MEEKNQQLSYLLKSLGKITVKALPDIVQMVPMYGPILSKALEKVLDLAGDYEDSKTNGDIQEQIILLKNAINGNKITEEKINSIIKKEIVDYIKVNEQRTPVYMFGVIIYPNEDCSIEQENMEEIDNVLSQEWVYDNIERQEYLEKIKEFCMYYNADDWFRKDDNYYLSSEYLIINFFDMFKYRRDDEEIINFILNMNDLLGQELFWEYTIF